MGKILIIIVTIAVGGIIWLVSINDNSPKNNSFENIVNKTTPAQALPFSVEEKSGKTISFSKETIEKPTLLVFWASWCPHCQRELPIIEEVWGELKDGIDIIAVRVFYDSQKQSIIDDDDFSFPIALNGQSAGSLYNITSIPTLVFVDEEFNIRERTEGELSKEQLLTKINNLNTPIEDIGVQEGTSLGNLFPNFNLTDVDGRTITRDTLAGKPTIIWFTTEFCVPCQIGAKKVAKLDDELGGSAFDVLVIFVDPRETDEDLISWRNKFANQDWMVAFDNFNEGPNSLSAKVGLKYLDSKYLLDKDSVIQNVDFQIANENYLNVIRGVANNS